MERTSIQGQIRNKEGLKRPVSRPNRPDAEKPKDVIARSKPAHDAKRGETVMGRVYNVTDEGVFIITPQDYIGFIHNSELTQTLNIGQQVEARISFVRPDGRLNLSMRPLKEVGRVTDAEKILEYLKKRDGYMMPYTDVTSPEVIKEKFGLSKSAFKRAIGKLMKEGTVEQKDGWTIMKNS